MHDSNYESISGVTVAGMFMLKKTFNSFNKDEVLILATAYLEYNLMKGCL